MCIYGRESGLVRAFQRTGEDTVFRFSFPFIVAPAPLTIFFERKKTGHRLSLLELYRGEFSVELLNYRINPNFTIRKLGMSVSIDGKMLTLYTEGPSLSAEQLDLLDHLHHMQPMIFHLTVSNGPLEPIYLGNLVYYYRKE